MKKKMAKGLLNSCVKRERREKAKEKNERYKHSNVQSLQRIARYKKVLLVDTQKKQENNRTEPETFVKLEDGHGFMQRGGLEIKRTEMNRSRRYTEDMVRIQKNLQYRSSLP